MLVRDYELGQLHDKLQGKLNSFPKPATYLAAQQQESKKLRDSVSQSTEADEYVCNSHFTGLFQELNMTYMRRSSTEPATQRQ